MKQIRAFALSKATIKEIENIVTGVSSGKLQHDQSSYHCGTAHCIAGWKSVKDVAKYWCAPELEVADFDAQVDQVVPEFAKKFCSKTVSRNQKSTIRLQITEYLFAQALESMIGPNAQIITESSSFTVDGAYAKNQWGLTTSEANRLFDGDASLSYMLDMIERWKQGLRLERIERTFICDWVDPKEVKVFVEIKIKPKKFC